MVNCTYYSLIKEENIESVAFVGKMNNLLFRYYIPLITREDITENKIREHESLYPLGIAAKINIGCISFYFSSFPFKQYHSLSISDDFYSGVINKNDACYHVDYCYMCDYIVTIIMYMLPHLLFFFI